MNVLYVGLEKEIEPPEGGCLWISDEKPDIKRPRIFNPNKHNFNPLEDVDYRKACDIVASLMAVFPGGENTLTKEGVPLVLLNELLDKPTRFDQLLRMKSKEPSYIYAQHMVERLMKSPVLKRVLCDDDMYSFDFDASAVIWARINRAELGDFDALVLGLFLIAKYPGQLVIPSFDFYGRMVHTALLREQRLIAGVTRLSALPEGLQQELLLIEEKIPSRATFEDAEALARYDCKFPPRTNEYNDFIQGAMS